MLSVPYSYLIVRPEKEYRDELGVKGLDGKSLVLDTTYAPEKHRVITAEVLAVPARLSDEWVTVDSRESDILPEVVVGDQVYFHYNTLTDENALITPEGKVWKLRYPDVFAVKRNGVLTMIGSWCLVEPCYPDGIERVDTPLGKAYKKGFLFLPDESVKVEEQLGILRHIGKPLKGQVTLPYKPGDKVVLAQYSDFINEIEGREYYTLHQSEILGSI